MRLLIRADGSRATGLGHVMRTLAIADAARHEGLQVRYAVADDPVATQLPSRRGLPVTVLEGPADRAWLDAIRPGDVVVFDGYHFTHDDHLAARSRGARVAAVDDLGRGRFEVDVLVNHNPVVGVDYRTPEGATILLGPAYALVRAEFTGRRRLRAEGRGRLVVTFGGSDPTGSAATVVRALAAGHPFAEVAILVGPAADRIAIPEEAAALRLVRDPQNVTDLFDEAAAAVAAAGGTTWELLCMGVPTALVHVAANQEVVARGAAAAGAALNLGPASALSERLEAVLAELATTERQCQLSRAGMRLVDGRGAERVLEALCS